MRRSPKPAITARNSCGRGAERVEEIADGGAHGVRADLLVGVAAGGVVGVRQQAFEFAARQDRGEARPALRRPLFEALTALDAAAVFVFLPAKERRARRHDGHREQKARVGENRRRFGQIGQIQARRGAAQRGLHELLREPRGIDVMARQLVDAVQIGRDRDARAGGEHVRLHLRAQRIGDVALERPRRNRVARPREHRRGDQQRLVGRAVDVES